MSTTDPNPPIRVIIYLRLSKDSPDSSSIAKQEQVALDYAKMKGWTIVDTISDVAVSATSKRLNRPGLNRARELIAAGHADAILAYRLDRIVRHVGDLSTLQDEGVRIISATEGFDPTTPMGAAMMSLVAVLAQLEASTTGERLRGMIAYRVSQGDRWRGASAPYGYKSVPHPDGGKTLVLEPDEADWVRWMVDEVLGGHSVYSVVKALNEAGVKPRKAESWRLASVKIILTGHAILGRQVRHGKPIRNPDGTIATPWPAIITLEEHERLVALLTPQPREKRRPKAARLLSGVLVCGSCGSRLRANAAQGRYVCHAGTEGLVCPAQVSIDAEKLEAHVVTEYLRGVGSLPLVEERLVVKDSAELARIAEAIAYVTAEMAQPGANISQLFEQLTGLTAERDRLAAMPAAPTVEMVETGQTYAEAWEASDLVRQQQLLRSALAGPISVAHIGRGARAPVGDRVEIPWRWEVDAAADALAGQLD